MAAPPEEDPLADLDPEALARAEAALQALSHHYLDWAEADLALLRAALAEVLAQPDQPAPLARLLTIAHDMKGQAATFGYPLITGIGESLCRLINETPTPDAATLARLIGMVEAITEVLNHRLEGDGGAKGRDILARLHR